MEFRMSVVCDRGQHRGNQSYSEFENEDVYCRCILRGHCRDRIECRDDSAERMCLTAEDVHFSTELKSPTKLVRRQKAVESWTGIRVCSGESGWLEANVDM